MNNAWMTLWADHVGKNLAGALRISLAPAADAVGTVLRRGAKSKAHCPFPAMMLGAPVKGNPIRKQSYHGRRRQHHLESEP